MPSFIPNKYTTILSLVCLLVASALAHAQAEFFDPTFGDGGKVIINHSGIVDGVFQSVRIQSDGRVVVAGILNSRATIGRFNENGEIDSSFASNGFFILPTIGNVFYDAIIQPDGKIVATGTSSISMAQFCLTVRLNADGTPDVTFGSGGIVNVNYVEYLNYGGASLTLQADGKIVLVGKTSPSNVGIARLHTNGTLDSTFGVNGLVLGPYGEGKSVAMAPDGKIVVGGTASAAQHYALMAVRYLPNGTLDTTFNHTGIVYTIAGEERSNFGKAVAVLPSGKILLAGSGGFGTEGSNFVIVRYSSSGVLDAFFGSGGIANIDFSGRNDGVKSMFLMPDGKILLTGTSYLDNQSKIAVARLSGSGVLDNLFGDNGKIINPINGLFDNGSSIVMQSDGKIIVAGNTYIDEFSGRPYVLRYLSHPAAVDDINTSKRGLVFYPNPANTLLHINKDAASNITSISAFDITGRQFPITPISKYTLNISHLPSGTYIFKVLFQDGSTTHQKILVRD